MPINHAYDETENDVELNKVNDKKVCDKVYSYDEALDLTGVGWYNRGLLATLSMTLLTMALDMFGFSVVVTGSACDLDLDIWKKSILMSAPFIGPVVMGYFWGYISDNHGRRKALIIGMTGSFIAAVISAFSTTWYMLTILRILGTSMSSSAQATSYTYLGESCPRRVRGPYMLVMSSVLLLFMLTYDVPAYFILNLKFNYPMGNISFTPWRLLALVLGAPLAINALLILFFFKESPKFELNAGKEEEALRILNAIWKRNGGIDEYPVKKVVLNEMKIVKKEESLAACLYEQVGPLFRLPLLWKTMQLFYLTAVIYGVNNSLIMWMPVIVKEFSTSTSEERSAMGLCDIIKRSQQNTTGTDAGSCTSSINEQTLISGIAHGLIFSILGLAVSKLASRKKVVLITFLMIPMICCIAAVYNNNDIVSLVLYVCMMLSNINMGVIFAYFVDIYPTSHTGMASCLAVIVARLSALACIHFVGQLVLKHCVFTFYGFAVYLLSGIAVTYFLPPDKPAPFLK